MRGGGGGGAYSSSRGRFNKVSPETCSSYSSTYLLGTSQQTDDDRETKLIISTKVFYHFNFNKTNDTTVYSLTCTHHTHSHTHSHMHTHSHSHVLIAHPSLSQFQPTNTTYYSWFSHRVLILSNLLIFDLETTS